MIPTEFVENPVSQPVQDYEETSEGLLDKSVGGDNDTSNKNIYSNNDSSIRIKQCKNSYRILNGNNRRSGYVSHDYPACALTGC